MPCWFLFPFVAPLVRRGAACWSAWPVVLGVPLLAFVSYLPVLVYVKTQAVGAPLDNYDAWNKLYFFPPAHIADFYAGVCVSVLAKLHRPRFKRLMESVASDVATSWAIWILAGLFGDLCLVQIALVTLRPRGHDHAELMLLHSETFPIVLFLYITVANGGVGIFTSLFRTPPFTALGKYALYAYLFQEPVGTVMAWLDQSEGFLRFAHKEHGALKFPQPPFGWFQADHYTLYLVTLWIVAGVYAEWIEAPFFDGLASCWGALSSWWAGKRKESGGDLVTGSASSGKSTGQTAKEL